LNLISLKRINNRLF